MLDGVCEVCIDNDFRGCDIGHKLVVLHCLTRWAPSKPARPVQDSETYSEPFFSCKARKPVECVLQNCSVSLLAHQRDGMV
jgi:hypothetical protein